MTVETATFDIEYVERVCQEIDDKIGTEYDVNEDEEDGTFHLVISDVETKKEVDMIRDIEMKYGAVFG